MRISIIADDLTGASDCGGQLVRYGLDVSVVLQEDEIVIANRSSIIFNTDSRSIPELEAYQKVRSVSERIKEESFDVLYKKIDSTMRGNIGQEINAMYDVFQPDFVFIAPASPRNGRKVIQGIHFLNQKQLHETEIGNDPKTPVNDSHITKLVQNQSKRRVGHLTLNDLEMGHDWVVNKLKSFKKENIRYVTVDSAKETDLECLVQYIKKTEYSVIWAGSAGLMNQIPKVYGLKQNSAEVVVPKKSQVLLVVGSVSEIGREQLNQVLLSSSVVGLEMQSTKIILDKNSRERELNRLLEEARSVFAEGKSVVLYSSKAVEQTLKIGKSQGLNSIQISNLISNVLGNFASALINYFNIKRLFLTGGDTAYQVFNQLQVKEFKLMGEVEYGIPLGKVGEDLIAVTKAGNFGTKLSMVKAILKLQGEDNHLDRIHEFTKIC